MPAAWPFSIPKENFYENRKKENLPEAGEKALQCGISSYDVSRLFFPDIFSYIPMVGILMAFQDFVPAKGLFGSDFVGLEAFYLYDTSARYRQNHPQYAGNCPG